MAEVWVGFMDTVPVIGSVKEGVDWALALYEDNPVVVKENIKMIKTDMFFSPDLREIELIKLEELEREAAEEPELVKGWKKFETAEGGREDPNGASGSGSASALQDVKAIELNALIEYVRCAAASKEKVQKTEDTLEKIRFLLPDYSLSTGLQRETHGAVRDVHVFNSDILTLQPKLLNELLASVVLPDWLTNRLKEFTYKLKPDTQNDVHNNMLVTFDETELYLNANSLVYDAFRSKLESLLVNLMRDSSSHSKDNNRRLREITWIMDKLEIYVDQMAKAKWIDKNPEKAARFQEVKEEFKFVISSYDLSWCKNIYGVTHR